MTKFKEYLRAKGVKLNCDYEALPYKNLETVETSATDGCVIATAYFNTFGPWSIAYTKHGECMEFCPDEEDLDLLKLYYGFEFTNWMCDTSCKISSTLFTVAAGMFKNDEKVRIAFRHMRAGIMNEEAFYKFLVRQYPKHIRNV